MHRIRLLPLAGAALAVATLVAACGGGDSNDSAATGTLRLSLTDAPACGYDNVFVTIRECACTRAARPVTATRVGRRSSCPRHSASTC